MAFELNGHCGEDLADLLLPALGADGDGFVVERLLLGEVVSAALATIVIGGHRSFPPLMVGSLDDWFNTQYPSAGFDQKDRGRAFRVSLAHPHYGLPWGFETGLWL